MYHILAIQPIYGNEFSVIYMYIYERKRIYIYMQIYVQGRKRCPKARPHQAFFVSVSVKLYT